MVEFTDLYQRSQLNYECKTPIWCCGSNASAFGQVMGLATLISHTSEGVDNGHGQRDLREPVLLLKLLLNYQNIYVVFVVSSLQLV